MRDRLEVRGLVEAALEAAVDAADPAGRDDLHTGAGRDVHSGRDGRRAEHPCGEHGPEIAERGLRDTVLAREPLEEHVAGAHDRVTVVKRDRRRGHAQGAYIRLERVGGLEIPRARQAVRDDRRLEGDDWAMRRERLLDLRRDGDPHRRPVA